MNVYSLFILRNQNQIYLYCFIYVKERKGNKLKNCKLCDFRERPLHKWGTDALFFVLSHLCCMQHIVLCVFFSVGGILLGECCSVSLANVFSFAWGLVT